MDGTEIRSAGRPPDARTGIPSSPGRSKQNAVKTMVLTDQNGRVLFSSRLDGSCADITRARQLGLVRLLADGPVVEIFGDAGYQGLGAQTGTRGDATAPQVQKLGCLHTAVSSVHMRNLTWDRQPSSI
ncbi:transposase family protein [Streptomyces sp. NPDC053431]|uniref:transposase family protein n=1 Tax=Streptomyces sp. NPDC053431 TaxID=3365703 RepID=UPI0037D7C125